MKVVIPDPDRVASTDTQTVAGYGDFPRLLTDTGRTESEWRKVIKDNDLPLKVVDRTESTLPAKDEGTAVEEVVTKSEKE